MSNQDMSQFMGIFVDEGREQIDLLETSFLDLEKPDHDPELLQVMFRAAHTLKGSSRAMGFSAMGDLTHRMEDVLDAVRQDRLGISQGLISVMLACLDQIKGLMDSIAAVGLDEVSDPETFASLLERLAGLLDPGSSVQLDLAPQPAPDYRIERNVIVTFDEKCEFCGVRAEMVIMAAEEIGTVIKTIPGREALVQENFGFRFEIGVLTHVDLQGVIDQLANVSEVASVDPKEEAEPQLATTAPNGPEPQTVSNPVVTEQPLPQPQAAADVSKPSAGTAAPSRGTAPASNSQTIRVDVNRLDALLNLVGELVTDRTQMANLCGMLQSRYHGDDLVSHVAEATTRIARVTGELQDEIMKTRMLPIDNAFQRMPRVVRDLAQNLGKNIKLDISGGDTEIDRSLIDALSDPLIHLLRNSVDHGVEDPAGREAAGKPAEGIVRLSARHEENNIIIEIIDDGKGIDPDRIKQKAVSSELISAATAAAMSDADALRLIFASGLSTAQEVSAISGRGVGMDIVKTNLEKIGGRITIESAVGKGTKFTIRLPLTLAIMRALLVESANVTYAVPLSSVIETLRLGTGEGAVKREKLSGNCAMVLRGQTVPLANLQAMLTRASNPSTVKNIPINACVVVVGAGSGDVGLCVDSLKGEQEIVIKPLGGLLGDVQGISGSSILGDGRVALIVDPAKAMVKAA